MQRIKKYFESFLVAICFLRRWVCVRLGCFCQAVVSSQRNWMIYESESDGDERTSNSSFWIIAELVKFMRQHKKQKCAQKKCKINLLKKVLLMHWVYLRKLAKFVSFVFVIQLKFLSNVYWLCSIGVYNLFLAWFNTISIFLFNFISGAREHY